MSGLLLQPSDSPSPPAGPLQATALRGRGMGSGARLWILSLPVPFTGCVTLGWFPNLSVFYSLICEIGVMIIAPPLVG